MILNQEYEQFKKKIFVLAAFLPFCFGLTGCDTPYHTSFGFQYSYPAWAPPFEAGARYYYLPDIEVYYDLSDQQYIYLDHAEWMFSPVLPSVYSWYDLNNGFVIALNTEVYQPWLHHQFYVSHYPRYYYHNYYKGRDFHDLRGFNENVKKPVFRQDDRRRDFDIRPGNRPPDKRPPNRSVDNKPEIKSDAPRMMPQPTNYYGRKIGVPVRVTNIMKQRAQQKKGGGRP